MHYKSLQAYWNGRQNPHRVGKQYLFMQSVKQLPIIYFKGEEIPIAPLDRILFTSPIFFNALHKWDRNKMIPPHEIVLWVFAYYFQKWWTISHQGYSTQHHGHRTINWLHNIVKERMIFTTTYVHVAVLLVMKRSVKWN